MHEPDVLVAECPRSTAADPSDDVQLVARLRAGDETAYEEVMRLYGGRLHAVARRLLGNDDDAWDAVQMALLSAFQSLDTFRGQSRLSTWLHRIVVNAALMKIRSRTRAREEPLGALLPAFMEDGRHAEPVSRSALPDELLAQREVRTAVRRCIERLPEPHRAVLVMRDIEELSTEETAAMLGVTPNAAKIRLHRARQALAALLQQEFGDARRAWRP
jgi:RNA polymerase sigma-70 factor (ECF subfamily)